MRCTEWVARIHLHYMGWFKKNAEKFYSALGAFEIKCIVESFGTKIRIIILKKTKQTVQLKNPVDLLTLAKQKERNASEPSVVMGNPCLRDVHPTLHAKTPRLLKQYCGALCQWTAFPKRFSECVREESTYGDCCHSDEQDCLGFFFVLFFLRHRIR